MTDKYLKKKRQELVRVLALDAAPFLSSEPRWDQSHYKSLSGIKFPSDLACLAHTQLQYRIVSMQTSAHDL